MPATRGGTGRRRGASPSYPPFLHEPYASTINRAPGHALLDPPKGGFDIAGPGPLLAPVVGAEADLTTNAGRGGEAIGERIIVGGEVLDTTGRRLPHVLIEVWQANAAGRYIHKKDQHDAPLDPHFLGIGRCITGDDGSYVFTSVKPGAYPWGNHHNAWRPAHIHFSVFGAGFSQRLVTQMYFPGDPLHRLDPIFNAVPDESARQLLVANYDHDLTRSGWALGYRFDLVVGGRSATPSENSPAG